MPWNFFKKKKKPADAEKKPTKTADNKKQPEESEDQWMIESIVQYLESPLWSNPISDFIDQNCVFFEENQDNENVAEQLRIFGEFKKFVSKELKNIMKDLGISETQFKSIFDKGYKDKEYTAVFSQLLILDYPEKFYELMVKRNKELEHEAAAGLGSSRLSTKSQDESMNSRSAGDDDELERALIASLQVEEERKRKAMDEDEQQLQEALKISQMEFDDAKKKAEQEKVQESVEETKNEEKVERKQKDFKINKKASTVKTEKDKKPLLSSDESALEASSISQTSEPEVKKEEKSQPKPVVEKESLNERKKRLQEQRELILAKKKAEREKEIKEYEQVNGITRVEEKEAPKEKEEEVSTDDVFLFTLQENNVDKKELDKRKDFFKKYKDLI